MFGRKKRETINEEKKKEKLARKLLGKGPKRRALSFLCAPHLHVKLKYQAKQLNIQMFAVAEHALELGANQIESALANLNELC